MIYTPRINTVEAVPVELSGKRFYAVAINDRAGLIDGIAFELLFSPEDDAKKIERLEKVLSYETRRKTEPKPQAAKPKPQRVSEVAQRCLYVLKEHGPLTSAELRDHVYRDEKDPKKRLQNFSALSIDMRRRGLIERRTDPETQLDKWHIAGKETHAGN